MRGSTSATFPGMSVHLQVCPVFLWSPPQRGHGQQLMAQCPISISVPPAWERRGQEYNARQDIGGGSGIRLLIGFWEVGRSKTHLGSYHSKHGTGVDVCPILKNQFICHIYFLWGKIFLSILRASTYIAALLGRRFEMHWLGQCENSLDTDTRIFPTARRPAQVFALQQWKKSVETMQDLPFGFLSTQSSLAWKLFTTTITASHLLTKKPQEATCP